VFIGLKKYPIAKKLFFASCRRLKAAGITFAQTKISASHINDDGVC
jgi:hypothetical protein